MKNRIRSPHLELAKIYWQRSLFPGDIAVDATCGNGYDTLFLASLPLSALFSLDIQPSAIEKTRALLSNQLSNEALERVHLYLHSHAELQTLLFPSPPRLFVYNLGYLPGGNKSITTRTETTLASLAQALLLIKDRGAISITCYPGHEEGEREEAALIQFAAQLPANQWQVCHHRWLNHPLRSPSLLWMTRID